MLRFFKLCSFVIFIRAPILKRKECKSLLKRCLQDLPDSIFTIGSEEINWNSSKKMFFQQMPLSFSILRYSVVDKEVPPQFALDIISKVFCHCLKFETKSSSVKMLLRNYGSDVCSALSGPRRPSVGSPYLRVCYWQPCKKRCPWGNEWEPRYENLTERLSNPTSMLSSHLNICTPDYIPAPIEEHSYWSDTSWCQRPPWTTPPSSPCPPQCPIFLPHKKTLHLDALNWGNWCWLRGGSFRRSASFDESPISSLRLLVHWRDDGRSKTKQPSDKKGVKQIFISAIAQ